jgi:alpha-beta hydrolase superfamily lysophospholipase
MKEEKTEFQASDGKSIHLRRFLPEGESKAMVLVVHGMAEHGARYARFAQLLCDRGYAVWIPDHRGHGLTARSPGELGILAEKQGFFRVMEDIHEISLDMKRASPGKPLILFGHSMGSFLSRGCVSRWGRDYHACVLSGTAGPSPMYAIGAHIAKEVCLFRGSRRPGPFLNELSFGSYNKAFKPNRTRFDWLSRDESEVDAYLADPLCGFLCSNGFFRDLTSGLAWIHKSSVAAGIPADLPLYLFAGTQDPVGGASGAVEAVAEGYRRTGIRRVDCRMYPGARHECLNETNREEVMGDCADWMDARLATR